MWPKLTKVLFRNDVDDVPDMLEPGDVSSTYSKVEGSAAGQFVYVFVLYALCSVLISTFALVRGFYTFQQLFDIFSHTLCTGVKVQVYIFVKFAWFGDKFTVIQLLNLVNGTFQVGFIVVRSVRRSNKDSDKTDNVVEVEGEEETQTAPSEEQPGPSNVVRSSFRCVDCF